MNTPDNLRKAAKRWLKALRANNAAARARLDRAYPGAPPGPGLRDVQHALARERGHENWKAMMEAGRDEVDPRESTYGATPIGWAAHGDKIETLDPHGSRIRRAGRDARASRTGRELQKSG